MGPPLKSFLKISRRQQRRRTRALLQVDINNLENAVNNIAPNPILPSCSQLTACALIPNDVCHEIDHFYDNFKRFDNADLNTDENSTIDRQTLTDRHIQMELQPQSTITRSTDFRAFLAHWAIQNKLVQSVVNDLLTGLRKSGHPELPSDSRTLFNTPNRIHIQALAGGSYSHYGLERVRKEQLRYRNLLQCIADKGTSVTFNININIDGLPLSKSSKSQLWPILGKVVGTHQFVEPFVIGAFHGSGKRSSAAQFLQAFLTEYTKLYSEGFMYGNRRYFVQLNAVLADILARNFISCFPAHNSRCAKCINLVKLWIDDEYFKKRIQF